MFRSYEHWELKLKGIAAAESAPSRVTSTSSTKVSTIGSSGNSAYALASKRSGAVKGQASPVVQPMNKIDAAPVIVPRNTPGAEPVVVRPVEISSTAPLLHLISAQINDSGRGNNSKNIGDGNQSAEIGSLGRKSPTHRGSIQVLIYYVLKHQTMECLLLVKTSLASGLDLGNLEEPTPLDLLNEVYCYFVDIYCIIFITKPCFHPCALPAY